MDGKHDLAVMARLINRQRQAAGLGPLQRDRQLDQVARRYIVYLMWCGSLHPERGREDHQTIHRRLRDAEVSSMYCGENIAMGASAEEVMQQLLIGERSRRNILHPSYGRLGLASRTDRDDDVPEWFSRTLYCQIFTD